MSDPLFTITEQARLLGFDRILLRYYNGTWMCVMKRVDGQHIVRAANRDLRTAMDNALQRAAGFPLPQPEDSS